MLKIYCAGCQIWFRLIAWYASISLKINWAIWLADLRGVYSFHRKSKYYYLPRAQNFLLAHSFGLIPKLKISLKPQNQPKFNLTKPKRTRFVPTFVFGHYLHISFTVSYFMGHILVICILIAIWSVYLSGIYQ